MNANGYKVGQKVFFGRGRGEQTLGEIVKVNRKRAKVKQLEARGTQRDYAIGSVWTVPYSLLTPAGDAKPLKGAKRKVRAESSKPSKRAESGHKISAFKVGDRVWWTNREGGRSEGIVRRVNSKSVTVGWTETSIGYARVWPGWLFFQGQAAA